MKRYIIIPIVLFFALLVFTFPAVAQSPTQTPVLTSTPYVTPTPLQPGELDYSCPAVGQPEGVGEYEIDPAWLSVCAHCLYTPTAAPTVDWTGDLGAIQCRAGQLNCTQLNNDTIYFTASPNVDQAAYMGGYMPYHTVGAFYLASEEANLYVTTQYNGMRQLSGGSYTVVEGGGQTLTRIDPGGIITEVGAMDTSADYSYSGTLDPGDYFLRHDLMNSELTDLQSWGCSRIYVSLDDGTYSPGACLEPLEPEENNFDCGADFTLSDYYYSGDNPDYWEHLDTQISCSQVSSSAIRCFGSLVAQVVQPDFQYDNVIYLEFTRLSPTAEQNYSLSLLAEGIMARTSEVWDHPNSNPQSMTLWNYVLHDRTYAGACGGDPYGTDCVIEVHFPIQGDNLCGGNCSDPYSNVVDVTWELVIASGPECLEDGLIPDKYDPYQEVTGSYCAVAPPVPNLDDVDFGLIINEPSSCMAIPAFEFGEAVVSFFDFFSAGLADFLASFYVSQIDLCYHVFHIKEVSILLVPIGFSTLVTIMIVVFVLRRLSSKAG